MERGAHREAAPTYLGWSICNTLCCCLPLGIAAIIYSIKAESANTHGEPDQALEASRTARSLNIFALVCGIILLIIFIALKTVEIKQHVEKNQH